MPFDQNDIDQTTLGILSELYADKDSVNLQSYADRLGIDVDTVNETIYEGFDRALTSVEDGLSGLGASDPAAILQTASENLSSGELQSLAARWLYGDQSGVLEELKARFG